MNFLGQHLERLRRAKIPEEILEQADCFYMKKPSRRSRKITFSEDEKNTSGHLDS